MTIHFNSKQSLVNYINSANSSALTVDELDFGVPQPIEGTWREDLIAANTAIKLTAREESNYTGHRVICYDRLDLADLNKLMGESFSIKCYQPSTNFDVIDPIFRRYGIVLTRDEFIEEPFEHVGLEPTECTITAKEHAFGWTGTLKIMSQEGNAVLSQHLTTAMLPGMNYPIEGDGTVGSAMAYFYGYDFTDHKDVLETYEAGTFLTVDDTDFLDAIKAIDTNAGKSLWNLTPESTVWSLEGAEVTYSGINSPLLPTNQSYKYVLGLLMKPTLTTPPGICYLHYDDPYDPNEV